MGGERSREGRSISGSNSRHGRGKKRESDGGAEGGECPSKRFAQFVGHIAETCEMKRGCYSASVVPRYDRSDEATNRHVSGFFFWLGKNAPKGRAALERRRFDAYEKLFYSVCNKNRVQDVREEALTADGTKRLYLMNFS